jgi:hypothetical protein
MDTDTLTPDVPCQVVPRPDAKSDERKALGLALASWSEQQLAADGLLRSIDNIVLTELLGGDDASDLVFAIVFAESDDDSLTILRRGDQRSDDAAQDTVVFCAFRGDGYSRCRAIASLRAGIPVNLVHDVLIDGRSWNEA